MTRQVRQVVDLSLRYDEVDVFTTYSGEAPAGSADSDPKWRIKLVTSGVGGKTIGITWADGNTNFDNVWNDRASLTYS
jgi:hypothetical protein